MEGSIRYIGKMPVYSFKMEWSPGQLVSLAAFQDHVSSVLRKNVQEESDFLSWLDTALEGKDFILESDVKAASFDDESETTEPVIELPVKRRGRPKKNTILVESGDVKISASVAEAKDRLRKMRHPDEVGEVVKDSSAGVKTNKTAKETVTDLENSPSHTITGDDLKPNSATIETNSDKRKKKVFMLNGMGEPVQSIPTSKEEQEIENAKSANLSGKVRIMQTEAGKDDSYIIDGGDKDVAHSSKNDNQVRPGKVNKYMQLQGSHSGSERTLTVEDFINQPNEVEIARLIKLCKDPLTLKMVKIYYKENGIHRLVDQIDSKLKTLVKF